MIIGRLEILAFLHRAVEKVGSAISIMCVYELVESDPRRYYSAGPRSPW